MVKEGFFLAKTRGCAVGLTITNVMAVSLDGKIASHAGETDSARRTLNFTNDVDRQHVR